MSLWNALEEYEWLPRLLRHVYGRRRADEILAEATGRRPIR
jgi:hypothetical protein